MDLKSILKSIDAQIARLQQARKALAGGGVGKGLRKGRRKMSAAARAKIGAAQRARWAKQKRAAAGKT